MTATSVMAQEKARLTFSPEHPTAGQVMTIAYTPLPSMTGNQAIKGIAYTFENFRWVGHDITVTNQGQEWKGTFTPSKTAGLVAFKFYADNITDNNGGQTFAMMLSDGKGDVVPGGYAAWGLLRSQKYGRDIPGYIDYTKTKEVSDTIVYYWLNNEVKRNPSTAVRLAPLYIRAMRAAKIKDAEAAAGRAVAYLMKVNTEEALSNAIEIMQGHDDQRADSLRKVVMKRFPNGMSAMWGKYCEKFNFRDPKAVKAHFSEFLRLFPYTKEREAYLNSFGRSYDDIYTSIILMDWMSGSTAEFDCYLGSLSFFGCNNLFYKMVNISHIRKDKTDAQLLPIATKIVDRMKQQQYDTPEQMSYLAPSEWKAQVENTFSSYVAETYSEILKGCGQTSQALEYARLAQKTAQYKRAEVNDNMAELLKATGNDKELKALLEKSVFNNQVSTMQTDMLRALYVKEKGSADGFAAYVDGLKNPAEKSSIKKGVEAYRRTGVMPEWTLKDADGKTVSSKDLKGKVYVLDFWANWCHPCKASLPGMQMAVDHYKNDPDVRFFFIDTQEYVKDYEAKAKAYLKGQGLNLHLVFDGKSAKGKTNDLLCAKVMKQYTISGIPMKVVVDAKGNVRFLAIGYKGSPSALRDEMIEMVEQAKRQ